MLVTLLVAPLAIAVAVSSITAWLFRRSIATILRRIVSEELAGAWQRYVSFAIHVVGISGGIRIWNLEQYVNPRAADGRLIVLNADRWTLEVYRTLIGTLQSTTWVLLMFFIAALIAFVVVRGFELRSEAAPDVPTQACSVATDGW